MFGIKYIANLDNADVEDEYVETAEEYCPIAAPVCVSTPRPIGSKSRLKSAVVGMGEIRLLTHHPWGQIRPEKGEKHKAQVAKIINKNLSELRQIIETSQPAGGEMIMMTL